MDNLFNLRKYLKTFHELMRYPFCHFTLSGSQCVVKKRKNIFNKVYFNVNIWNVKLFLLKLIQLLCHKIKRERQRMVERIREILGNFTLFMSIFSKVSIRFDTIQYENRGKSGIWVNGCLEKLRTLIVDEANAILVRIYSQVFRRNCVGYHKKIVENR